MKVLANDGLTLSGINALEGKGFTVITEKVPKRNLFLTSMQKKSGTLLVRSATKVTKGIIDNCPSLQIIGRGGSRNG